MPNIRPVSALRNHFAEITKEVTAGKDELYRTSRPMRNELRKVPVKGFVLYYAVFEEQVEIRRFLHGRRNRSALFD